MDVIKRNLTLISSLTPGYTINVKTRKLVYHGILSSVKRKWHQESRETCMQFVVTTVDHAIGAITSELSILSLLKECRAGIISLKETYNDDINIIQDVDNILMRIDNTITRSEFCIITKIEQIPELLKFMETRVGEYESCLVKQTPIPSPYAETPPETPVKSVCVTVPATPPSSPSRELDMMDPEFLKPPSEQRSDMQHPYTRNQFDLMFNVPVWTWQPLSTMLANFNKDRCLYPLPRFNELNITAKPLKIGKHLVSPKPVFIDELD